MRKLLLTAAIALLPGLLLAQSKLNQIEGCLANQGGQYLLVQQNPRRAIQLRGNERILGNRVGQLVILKGHPGEGQGEQNLREYWVTDAEPKASRCPEPISGALPSVPVSGKAGGRETATPTTTSSTAGETTPGIQTEAGYEETPGKSTLAKAQPPSAPNQPAGPPNMAMGEQTANTADLSAEAAARAEYGARTLGVATYTPQQNGPQGDQGNAGPLDKQSQIGYQSQLPNAPTAPAAGYPNPRNVEADTLQVASAPRTVSPFPTTVGQAHPAANIQITGQKLNPLQVTIKPGQTVQWSNASGTTVKKLQEETGKFTAGELQPGASFTHTFDRPGRYEYSLRVGERQLTGAVNVQP